jgi:hypothetical protein
MQDGRGHLGVSYHWPDSHGHRLKILEDKDDMSPFFQDISIFFDPTTYTAIIETFFLYFEMEPGRKEKNE